MRDLMIVLGVICALAGLGLALYDHLEKKVPHEAENEE